MRDTVLRMSKSAYVSGMKTLGSGLRALHVLDDAPPPRAARTKHWFYSLTRVYDPQAMIEMDVPWWTYDAIDAVESWLGGREHARIFEYGSGASSLWLARRAGEVHSVEHHEGFYEYMRPAFEAQENLSVELVEPEVSDHPAVPSQKEGQSGLDFADYVAAIDRAGGTFDLVVVDGRARGASLARAVHRLAPDGLVVFDNSRRARYRPAIEGSGLRETRCTGLTPTLPYGEQTSLLTPA